MLRRNFTKHLTCLSKLDSYVIMKALDSTVVQSVIQRKFSKPRPLAKILGIHSRTLTRLADAGHIHRYKLSSKIVLFDEAEVLAYIDKSRIN